MRRRGEIDYRLLGVTLIMLVFGLVMMYSASAAWAQQHFGAPTYFLKRQLIWMAIGLPLMAFLSRFDYNRLGETSWVLFFLTVVGLAAALVSPKVAGARRWVRLGPIGLQPDQFGVGSSSRNPCHPRLSSPLTSTSSRSGEGFHAAGAAVGKTPGKMPAHPEGTAGSRKMFAYNASSVPRPRTTTKTEV